MATSILYIFLIFQFFSFEFTLKRKMEEKKKDRCERKKGEKKKKNCLPFSMVLSILGSAEFAF